MLRTPSPAAATGLPETNLSRRAMLGGIPAAAIATTAVLSTAAMAAEPSEIELAFREYRRLDELANAAFDTEWEVEDLYIEPPRPKWYPAGSAGGYHVVRLPDGKYLASLDTGDENISYLNDLIASPPPEDEDDAYFHQQGVKDARETLSQIEGWKAECERRKDACGLTQATARREAAIKERDAQRDRVYAIDAMNVRDLAFQAAIIIEYDLDDMGAGGVLKRMIELVGLRQLISGGEITNV